MTTEKLTLNIRESDQYATEPQSVLEKLKRSKEQLDSLDCRKHETYESFLAVQLEANWRIYKVLPRLIAALELVEAKAKETRTVKSGYSDAKIDLARELIELINGGES